VFCPTPTPSGSSESAIPRGYNPARSGRVLNQARAASARPAQPQMQLFYADGCIPIIPIGISGFAVSPYFSKRGDVLPPKSWPGRWMALARQKSPRAWGEPGRLRSGRQARARLMTSYSLWAKYRLASMSRGLCSREKGLWTAPRIHPPARDLRECQDSSRLTLLCTESPLTWHALANLSAPPCLI
jgi:hypothetical protein